MLDKLALLKRKALRKGIWFRVLSPIERSIYDLTMRTVNTIKSRRLFNIIKVMMEKLRRALESPIRALMRTIGHQLAMQMACVACSWGHPKAHEWSLDRSFTKYLTVCWYMNVPKYYRSAILSPKYEPESGFRDFTH